MQLIRMYVCAVMASLSLLVVRAAVIEVPVGGNIANAISSANDGDVVQLAAGTYTTGAGTISKAITLRGAGRFLTRLVASTRLVYLNHADAVVSDLTLSGAVSSSVGAGARIEAGTLQDVIVEKCKTTGAANGAGIYITGGTVRRCVVTGCTAGGNYAGICLGTGSAVRLESVLVYGNNAASSGYGGLYVPGKVDVTIVNCTFAGNMTLGATLSDTSCSSANCHYVNTYRGVASGTAGTYDNSPDRTSVPAPGFLSPNGGIYRLVPTSPLLGAGGETDAVADVDGNPMSATPSIGACQPAAYFLPSAATTLLDGSVDVTVRFPSGVTGSGTLNVVSPDATVAESTVADDDTVSVAAAQTGSYSLFLDIQTGGGTMRVEMFNAFSVGVAEAYVDPGSKNPSVPYSTPETAARTVADALAVVAERGTVWVCDSTNSLSATIALHKPVTIRGVNGSAEAVFLQTASRRLFELDDPGARLSNLTIRGNGTGYQKNGMGVAVLAGGGVVEDCVIENFVDSYASNGGAVTVDGPARFERCIIRNSSTQSYAGGLYSSAYVELRNCLFYGNQAKQNVGAAVYVAGPGLMVNCTVCDNFLGAASAGLCEFYRKGDGFAVTNCIFGSASWNSKTGNAAHNLYGTAADPVPVSIYRNPEDGDYRLKASALDAIDQGDDEAVLAEERDLGGEERILGDHVDLGCYEFVDSEFSVGFAIEGSATAVGDTVRLVPLLSGVRNPVNDWRVVNACGGADIVGRTVGADAAFEVTFTAPGVYSVFLSVTDGDNAASSAQDAAVVIVSSSDRIYVAMPGTGTPVAPFDTPETAATNLWAAVKALPANATAYVLAGTHRVGRRVVVDGGRQVVGAGREKTVVTVGDSSACGVFEIAHEQSVVRALSVTGGTGDGYNDGWGVGVRVTAGLLSDCLLTNLVQRAPTYGSALAAVGEKARVSRVEVRGCRNEQQRGTVYVRGDAKFDNTLVADSTAASSGSALYLEYNCAESKGSFSNCTFVGTDSSSCYIGKSNALFRNCLFDSDVTLYSATSYANAFFGCNFTENIPETHFSENGNHNVAEADVGFVKPLRGDYHLKMSSPLARAGLYDPAMRSGTDLDGRRRTRGNTVAIGCYQPVPNGLSLMLR